MDADTDTIAWLIPTLNNRPALQAAHLPANAAHQTPSPLPTGGPALRLTFSKPPSSPSGFLIGTDPACDIVLPKLPGLSRRHAHLAFDASSRLVLTDTSRAGSAVWYDHQSNGDRRGGEWVLSSGFAHGFPDHVGRIVLDFHNVRFQVVVKGPGDDVDGYVRRVDEFMAGLGARDDAAAAAAAAVVPSVFGGWDGAGFVKHLVEEEGKAPRMFLWNSARPWDPIIPVSEY